MHATHSLPERVAFLPLVQNSAAGHTSCSVCGETLAMEGPKLTVDCVVFNEEGRLLLIRRARPPFSGEYALPGGFVDIREMGEAASLRELKEETVVAGEVVRLVGGYSDLQSDSSDHA